MTWTQWQLASWVGRKNIVRFENRFPKNYARDLQRFIKPKDQVFAVVHTRDLLNFLASRVRWGNRNPVRNPEVGLWLIVAKESFGETNTIPADKIGTVYDWFKESEQIRREVCAFIGGVYSEDEFERVPSGGRGSSFDQLQYEGRGSEMNTLKRYEQVLANPKLSRPFKYYLNKNQEALKFYLDHFQPDDEKRAVIKELVA